MSKIAVATAAANQGAADAAATGKQDQLKGDAAEGNFQDVLNSRQGADADTVQPKGAANGAAKGALKAGDFAAAMATSAQVIAQGSSAPQAAIAKKPAPPAPPQPDGSSNSAPAGTDPMAAIMAAMAMQPQPAPQPQTQAIPAGGGTGSSAAQSGIDAANAVDGGSAAIAGQALLAQNAAGLAGAQTAGSPAGDPATSAATLRTAAQVAALAGASHGKGTAKTAGSAQGSGANSSKAANSAASLSRAALDPKAATDAGTAIAMHERAMATNAQLQEPVNALKAKQPANSSSDAADSQASAPAPAKGVTSVPAQASQQQPATTVSSAAAAFSVSGGTAASDKTAQASGTAPSAPAQAAASSTLNQVLEATDRMRSTGQNHVEVQVKLETGDQLTVRLQMSQGTIKPVFRTESPELRQAIEQNWAGFRSAASERGLQISNPVFESPSSQGGFNAFSNREQSRQQANDAYQPDGMSFIPSGAFSTNANSNPANPVSIPASPVESGVQLYA